ncbi:MAG: hypothetical protein AAFZ09_10825, partial [Pseudomonadota bacterium]
LLQVREKVSDYIDLQLVAFPQDGLLRSATARENMIRALDMGDPDRCLAIFRSTRWGGLALVLGLVLDSLAIT